MSNSSSWLSRWLELLSQLLSGAPKPTAPPPSTVLAPMQPRVLLIVYNPVVDESSDKRLIEEMGWNDPEKLAQGYIDDLRECSGGLVNYTIIDRITANEIPVKVDEFQYTPQTYLNVCRTGQGGHDPDNVDYPSILAKFDLIQRITNNEIDEVWMFGAPYFGFWESTMAGRNSFFLNSEPVKDTDTCPRRFVLMGFNYERGIGEMLEDFGHRTESTMTQVFRYKTGAANLFERYTLYDQVAAGRANIGSVHFAPNSVRDYDWGNMTPVQSCADDWAQFPALPNPPNYRMMDARDWGKGDIRGHHKWWLAHLPQAAGATDGVSNNWWWYVVDPNNVA